jgi:putative redox protein
MLKAKVKWVDGFRFDATDAEGRELALDASVAGGGTGKGMSPALLPLIGLAGCTGIDTLEILQKMREPVNGLEVSVSSKKKEGIPSGYDGIELEYIVRGKGISPEKVEKAVRLSEEKYCTVGQVLSKATTITHTIKIVEE